MMKMAELLHFLILGGGGVGTPMKIVTGLCPALFCYIFSFYAELCWKMTILLNRVIFFSKIRGCQTPIIGPIDSNGKFLEIRCLELGHQSYQQWNQVLFQRALCFTSNILKYDLRLYSKHFHIGLKTTVTPFSPIKFTLGRGSTD